MTEREVLLMQAQAQVDQAIAMVRDAILPTEPVDRCNFMNLLASTKQAAIASNNVWMISLCQFAELGWMVAMQSVAAKEMEDAR